MMLREIEKVLPSDIEKRSFEIITEELGDKKLIPGTEMIVKRCIHTSADFDYADNLVFSDNVVEKALKAIRNGASVVTDTQMGKAGTIKNVLRDTAEKSIVLCLTKMWLRRQRKIKRRGLLPVWTRRQNWEIM